MEGYHDRPATGTKKKNRVRGGSQKSGDIRAGAGGWGGRCAIADGRFEISKRRVQKSAVRRAGAGGAGLIRDCRFEIPEYCRFEIPEYCRFGIPEGRKDLGIGNPREKRAD
jgi:hypothetical protein